MGSSSRSFARTSGCNVALVSFKLDGRQKNEQVQYRTSANEANVTNKCYHTKHTRTNVPRLVPYRKILSSVLPTTWRRADAPWNSSSRGPFRAPVGSIESTRNRAARCRGPFLRTPLSSHVSSRVGTGPPVLLSFTSAVFVCGIPGSERAMCRVPLFHRNNHTPILTLRSGCDLPICRRSLQASKEQGRAST